MTIKGWLRRSPQPASVRCVDDERTVKIGIARSKWRDAEQSLSHASGRLEALDSDGAVLRSFDVEAEDSADRESRTSRDRMTELATIAQLLVDAADKSAARHADAFRLCYEQQGILVTAISQRLSAMEKAWHSLLMSQTPGEADQNADMVKVLMSGLAGGLMQGAPTSTPPNGAK